MTAAQKPIFIPTRHEARLITRVMKAVQVGYLASLYGAYLLVASDLASWGLHPGLALAPAAVGALVFGGGTSLLTWKFRSRGRIPFVQDRPSPTAWLVAYGLLLGGPIAALLLHAAGHPILASVAYILGCLVVLNGTANVLLVLLNYTPIVVPGLVREEIERAIRLHDDDELSEDVDSREVRPVPSTT